jgi:hypothetical protein
MGELSSRFGAEAVIRHLHSFHTSTHDCRAPYAMKVTTNDTLHHAHAEALLNQLVRDTVEVLEQYGLFRQDQSQDLAKDLLFRISAVLDGSSYPGSLNGDEIAPFVGFYLGHNTQTPLVPENGSGMHALIHQAVDGYFESRSAK